MGESLPQTRLALPLPSLWRVPGAPACRAVAGTLRPHTPSGPRLQSERGPGGGHLSQGDLKGQSAALAFPDPGLPRPWPSPTPAWAGRLRSLLFWFSPAAVTDYHQADGFIQLIKLLICRSEGQKSKSHFRGQKARYWRGQFLPQILRRIRFLVSSVENGEITCTPWIVTPSLSPSGNSPSRPPPYEDTCDDM